MYSERPYPRIHRLAGWPNRWNQGAYFTMEAEGGTEHLVTRDNRTLLRASTVIPGMIQGVIGINLKNTNSGTGTEA